MISQATGSSVKSLDAPSTAVGPVTQVLLSTNDIDINHSVAEQPTITVPTAENLTVFAKWNDVKSFLDQIGTSDEFKRAVNPLPSSAIAATRLHVPIDMISQATGSSVKSLDAPSTTVGPVTQVLLSTNDVDVNHSVAEQPTITVPTAENLTIFAEWNDVESFLDQIGTSDEVKLAVTPLPSSAIAASPLHDSIDMISQSTGWSEKPPDAPSTAVGPVTLVSPTKTDVDVNQTVTEQSKMTVLTANNSGGIRRWDKYNYCVYCMDPHPKLSVHFQQKHNNETEVKRIFSLPKNSDDRKLLLMKLTNSRDYAHNTFVLRKGEGVIVPYRRPAEEVDYNEYLPCDNCYGFFKSNRLWQH